MNHLPPRTTALIERHVAGLLDDAEKIELTRYLNESAEARRVFLEHMDLNASLFWISQSQATSRGDEVLETSAESTDRGAIHEAKAGLSAPLPQNVEGLLGDPAPTQPSSGFSPYVAMLGFFAMGIVLTIGVFQAMVEQPETKPLQKAVASDHISEIRAEELKSDIIQLKTGSMNLILSKVGNVIIHGPAELQLLGPYRARLLHGQIKVNVSEDDAEGKFVVETPDGNITNLGTEFVLNVSPGAKSSVSVLTGKVNLQVAQESLPIDETPSELLNQGDGVTFRKGFETERLMSIVSDEDPNSNPLSPTSTTLRTTIREVSDNLQKSDTKKFYQIVPHGMKYSVSAYVDRTAYLWIGAKNYKKIPDYLIGGDYVRTFNQDKINSDLALKVTLNEPCDLYVLFDTHLQLPDWLMRDFTRCEEVIATSLSDESIKKKRKNRITQSGTRMYDLYTIWKRTIPEAGTVELGSNFSRGAINFNSNDILDSSMYGIVAVPLKRAANDPPASSAKATAKFE